MEQIYGGRGGRNHQARHQRQVCERDPQLDPQKGLPLPGIRRCGDSLPQYSDYGTGTGVCEARGDCTSGEVAPVISNQQSVISDKGLLASEFDYVQLRVIVAIGGGFDEIGHFHEVVGRGAKKGGPGFPVRGIG